MSDQELQEHEAYSDWREYRRYLAWAMVQQGMTQKAVAELLDVTQAAVSQWVKRAREGGKEALAAKPYPERARKLAEEHIDNLKRMLAEGAAFHGLGEKWTMERVAQLIEETFGVRYHPAHVSRLLKQWGLVLDEGTPQPA
ncbi:MAG: helix-turn-helix domain-containing protein [Myxococcota bacterium]